MPTRKISDPPKSTCLHPEHDIPMYRVFDSGVWEHTCPSCGAKKIFTIDKCSLNGRSKDAHKWCSKCGQEKRLVDPVLKHGYECTNYSCQVKEPEFVGIDGEDWRWQR